MSQDIKIVDKLDPSAVNDREGLADFLGNTRTVLKQLDETQAVSRGVECNRARYVNGTRRIQRDRSADFFAVYL